MGSAFSKTLEGLIATQGLVYGLGILLSEMPTSIILNTWFVRRRGLAYGVLFGSTDLFGVGWSFLASATLSRHGTTTTFLMFAAICFVITGIAICFLRRRRPSANQDSPTDNAVSSDDVVETAQPPRRYYLRVSFYLLMAANLLLSLAFYLPFIYLPTYTTMLDSSATRGTIVLGVANAAQIVGEITFGMLSDKFDVHLLATLAALVGCLSTFFLWGFANSFGLSIVFALVFGASASGFIALWPRMGTLFGEADASMIYSFMSFGRGLGAIASGPISAALIPDQRVGQSVLSAQHQFRYVIVFVGSCMAASAAVVFTGWLASFWSGKSKGLHGHKGVGTV